MARVYFLTLLLGACAESPVDDSATTESPDCDGPYEAFDPARSEEPDALIGAHEIIKQLALRSTFGAADFYTIEDLYWGTPGLQQRVHSTSDLHDGASLLAVGPVLDATINEAIAAGLQGEDPAVHALVVDVTLQQFLTLRVYSEGAQTADISRPVEDMRVGWDGAFGYFGTNEAGTFAEGMAATLDDRDDAYGTTTLADGFGALLAGHCALAQDEPLGAAAALGDLDTAMMEGMALSIVHAMDGHAADPTQMGNAGALYWAIVDDHVRARSPSAADVIQAEFDRGPEDLDASRIRAEITSALDLDV